jgi:phage gpG-like protein
MAKPPDFSKLRKQSYQLYTKAASHAGALAVRQMQRNFRQQGWTPGKITIPWTPRKGKEKGRRRAILVKSGALRRSIRVLDKGLGYVKIGTNMPYSKIHNEGGVIQTTQSVGEHTRRAHTRKRGRGRGSRISVPEAKVKAHTRKVNTRIPKRQFVGPSSEVLRQTNEWLKTEIDKMVKKWQ